jgi:integrase
MVAYRHGLRAVEAADLEWSRIEFGRNASPHVRRAKKGKPAVHPIRGDELRMLTALCKDGIFAAGDWRAERASETISPRRDRKSETTTREKWSQKESFCQRAVSCAFRKTGRTSTGTDSLSA